MIFHASLVPEIRLETSRAFYVYLRRPLVKNTSVNFNVIRGRIIHEGIYFTFYLLFYNMPVLNQIQG